MPTSLRCVVAMHFIAKRTFQIPHPVIDMSISCADSLFRTGAGEFFLHQFEEDRPDTVLQIDTRAALAWLNTAPEDLGFERCLEGD